MSRQITTVKALCAAGRTPYHEASIDAGDLKLARRRLGAPEEVALHAPYVYCGLVQDVHIFGRSFLHTKGGAFVFNCQSYQNYRAQDYEECAVAQIDGRRGDLFMSYIEEECIFLGGTWTEPTPYGPGHVVYGPNFGHFIFEYLNRLAVFDLYGLTDRLPVVVYDCLPKPWLGFLELMGVPPARVRVVPIDKPPAYRKVWVSSSCFYRDSQGLFRFWPAGLHWLRNRLYRAIGGPQLHARRRLYIGRDNAKYRRIVNEDKVKATLAELGFECPTMSALSAREQLELISGADIVVYAAGAGCVIAHFAPEHCINILLAPHGVGTGYWGGLGGSIVLRNIYERIDGTLVEPADTERRANVGGLSELADYGIDVELLRGAVLLALQDMVRTQRRDAAAL